MSRDLTGRNWSFERKARERMRKGYWGALAGSPHPAGSNTVARGSRVPHTPGEVQRKENHTLHTRLLQTKHEKEFLTPAGAAACTAWRDTPRVSRRARQTRQRPGQRDGSVGAQDNAPGRVPRASGEELAGPVRTALMPGLSDARRAVGRAAARPPRSATAGPCTSTRVTCCRSVCDARRRSDHWTGGVWCWGREGRAPGTQRPRRKGRVSSSPGRLPRDSEARLQRPHADTCDSAPGNGTRSGGEAGKGRAEPQARWGSRAVSCLPPGPRRGRTATV